MPRKNINDFSCRSKSIVIGNQELLASYQKCKNRSQLLSKTMSLSLSTNDTGSLNLEITESKTMMKIETKDEIMSS